MGTQIKKFRKQAGLTQAELAEKVGVHETTIRRWEQERDRGPDGNTITVLAEIFHTTPEQFLTSLPDDVNVLSEKDEKENLVYEWGGGHKLVLPNTPETREMFQKIVLMSMSNIVPQGAMA